MNEICPFEKLCPKGCPCVFYQCEHVDVNNVPLAWYYKEGDPLFKTVAEIKEDTASIEVYEGFPARKMRNLFSRLASVDPKTLELKNIYERIIFQKLFGYKTYDTTILESYRPDFIESVNYNPKIALYFQGNHYLVDDDFRTYLLKAGEITDLIVESELMLSR